MIFITSKVLNLVRSARNRLRPVWITFGIVFSVFQTLKRFLTSFSILFNFQGPVAPQPCGWRPVYFTTEVAFCQALFFRSFWTFWTWSTSNISVSTVSLSGWDPSILLSQDRSVCLNAPLGRFIAFATAKLFSVYWFFSRASCWGFGSHSFASALGAQV